MKEGIFLWAVFLSLTLAPASMAAEESVPVAATEIVLSQDGSTVSGAGASVEGNTVTISADGAYRISGSLEAGQIRVDAGESDSIGIALDEVELVNESAPAIDIENAGDVTLYLPEGSENHIAGAVFSDADLIISGSGSLQVTGYENNGICCMGDLTISGGGQITVKAPGPGITAEGAVVLGDCVIEIQ